MKAHGKFLRRAAGGLCGALLSLAASSLAAQVKEAPPAPRFEIRRFVVEGNTLLPAETVERLLAPYTGPGRDFGSVQQALEALQGEYLERGYNAVRVLIPEQELRDGVVRLQVIEARVRRVLVEGNRHFDEANVRAGAPSLRAGESPNSAEIGRNMQLVNENPAKSVAVRLQAVAEEPARVDAVLRVTDHPPARWIVSADDTGNRQTGRYRVGLGFVHANVGGRDHVFNAQFITSPGRTDDVRIFGFGYRIPFYPWNSALDLVLGHSDVDSGTVADLFTVSGRGTVASARWGWILPRLGAYEQKLVASLDWRDLRQNVQFVGGGGGLVPDIRLKPLALSYLGRYPGAGYETSFQAGFVQNLPGGKDGGQETFDALRAGAQARYRILRYEAQAIVAAGGGFLVQAALSGQYTRHLLVPAEQFGMGGAASVRGFFERELATDIGHRASLELHFPDLGARMGEGWRARPIAFVDFARGRDNAPVRAEEQGLASFGVGLRVGHGRDFALRLDAARVENDAGSRRRGDSRLHFAVSYAF